MVVRLVEHLLVGWWWVFGGRWVSRALVGGSVVGGRGVGGGPVGGLEISCSGR